MYSFTYKSLNDSWMYKCIRSHTNHWMTLECIHVFIRYKSLNDSWMYKCNHQIQVIEWLLNVYMYSSDTSHWMTLECINVFIRYKSLNDSWMYKCIHQIQVIEWLLNVYMYSSDTSHWMTLECIHVCIRYKSLNDSWMYTCIHQIQVTEWLREEETRAWWGSSARYHALQHGGVHGDDARQQERGSKEGASTTGQVSHWTRLQSGHQSTPRSD